MNNIQKMKQKIKDNRHNIFAVAFVGSLVTLVIAAEISIEKQEAESKKKLNEYIVKENRAGRTVLQLADGSFVGVAL